MPIRQSFAFELVGREEVGNAVALNSAMFNGARVIGPAAAGLAIAAFGVGPAFAINALSFLAVIVGLRMMDDATSLATRIARPETRGRRRPQPEEGLQYVRAAPRSSCWRSSSSGRRDGRHELQRPDPRLRPGDLWQRRGGLRFLMAASGVGSLFAAMRLVFGGGHAGPTRDRGADPWRGIRRLAVTRDFPVALGLMVLIGFGSILMAATGNATIQLAVPDQLRGRVMSVYTTAFSASVPLGGLAMGALASASMSRSRSRSVAPEPARGLGRWPGVEAGAFASVDSPAPAEATGGMVPGGAHPR